MLITPIQKGLEGGREGGSARNNDSADEKGIWAGNKRMTKPVASVCCHSAGALQKLNVAVANIDFDSSKN